MPTSFFGTGSTSRRRWRHFFSTSQKTRPVVAVAEQLPRNLLIAHDDYADRHDPHVWMNPNLWSRVVLEVRDALTEVHPGGADMFRANADAYLEELAALAQYTQAGSGHGARRKPRAAVGP